jgi:NIPSNAP
MVYLHVTFRLEAQDVTKFESFYAASFLPVILEHGFEPVGIFKTLVGRAGELTEIWRFESLSDYERKWKALLADPRVESIFETTGPMVKDETFKLMESVSFVPFVPFVKAP